MARVQALSFCLRSLVRHNNNKTSSFSRWPKNVSMCRSVQLKRLYSSSSETNPQLQPNTSSKQGAQRRQRQLQINNIGATFTFDDRDGYKKTVTAKHGELLLDVAKNNDVDLEGACEGTLSCSTCHLIFDPEEFSKLDLNPPDAEELDMMDLAYGLTDTSRLGCQIEVTEKFDGITIKVPEATRDARNS